MARTAAAALALLASCGYAAASPALDFDDECAASGDCALNALQMRGRPSGGSSFLWPLRPCAHRGAISTQEVPPFCNKRMCDSRGSGQSNPMCVSQAMFSPFCAHLMMRPDPPAAAGGDGSQIRTPRSALAVTPIRVGIGARRTEMAFWQVCVQVWVWRSCMSSRKGGRQEGRHGASRGLVKSCS